MVLRPHQAKECVPSQYGDGDTVRFLGVWKILPSRSGETEATGLLKSHAIGRIVPLKCENNALLGIGYRWRDFGDFEDQKLKSRCQIYVVAKCSHVRSSMIDSTHAQRIAGVRDIDNLQTEITKATH